MTESESVSNIVFMGTPGRRPGTPAEFQAALFERVRTRREAAKYDIPRMAKALTVAMGRTITADTYRKWESASMIPHDAILPFCDLTKTHPFELLAKPLFASRAQQKNRTQSAA